MPRGIQVNYVQKEFDISKPIELPKIISSHKFEETYLFIAPEKATWITSSSIGKDILDYLKKGFSLKEVMAKLSSKGLSEKSIVSEIRDFLISIEKNGFLEEREVKYGETEKINLQLYLTNQCNLNCKHCYMDSGKPRPHELSTEEFARAIDKFSTFSGEQVIFTGGEPLLFQDLFALAKRAKTHQMKTLLFTNGTLINEKMIPQLKNCIDEIQLSLDGASPKINDMIRGNGVYKKVLQSIDILKKTNIKLRLAMVAMPQNIEDLESNIVSLAKKLDGVEMKFGFAINSGRSNSKYRFPDSATAESALQKVLALLYKNRLKSMSLIERNLIVKNCGYGEVITISSNGDIYPCAVLINKAGNLKMDDFSKVLEKIRADAKASEVDNYEECKTCDLKYICFGGCRLNNITHNKNLLQVYCPQGKKEDYYKLLIRRNKFDALGIWLGCQD